MTNLPGSGNRVEIRHDQADRADKALAAGKPTGLLHGIPMTVTDTYRVKGMPATAGYPPLQNHVPDEDAVIVKLLKEQGAIILGKTNAINISDDDKQKTNQLKRM